MNTKQKLHKIKLQQWASRFQEQASSSLTVKAWCTENNISIHRVHPHRACSSLYIGMGFPLL